MENDTNADANPSTSTNDNSTGRKNFPRRQSGQRNRDRDNNVQGSELICTVCRKPLHELHSAIAGADNAPVHFDCAIRQLAESEELEDSDKICYLGKGSFGIITFRNSSSPIRFLIKKRIQFEELEGTPDWRKNTEIQVRKEIKPRPKNRRPPRVSKSGNNPNKQDNPNRQNKSDKNARSNRNNKAGRPNRPNNSNRPNRSNKSNRTNKPNRSNKPRQKK